MKLENGDDKVTSEIKLQQPYELDSIIKDMEQKIKDANVERDGNPITATYAMDTDSIEII